jgi:ureidoacrylate peracid hydrolase
MLANTQLPRLLALGARLSCMRRSPSPRVTTRSAPTRTEFSKAVDGNAVVKSSWVAAIVDDLAPAERDIVIEGKRGLDTFASTNLDFILRSKGITTLVLGGFLTNCCVESTMRSGYENGRKVITLSDCVAATSSEEHDNALKYDYPMFSQPMSSADFIAELGA